MSQSALDRARTFQTELSAIRRDIHAHPELGLEEHRTADLVARKLEEWGIEVHRGVGKTGVVGVLRNGNGQDCRRPARRHGRAADPGGDRPAVRQPEPRPDACLRPRRPHHHAAGRGEIPGGDPQLQRHRELHLPAGRGRHRRRAGDAAGRPVRTFPLRRRLRHAQPARGGGRPGSPPAPGSVSPAAVSSTSPSPARARTARIRIRASIPSWSPAISAPRCSRLCPATSPRRTPRCSASPASAVATPTM